VQYLRILVLIGVVVPLWILTLGGPRDGTEVWAQLGAPPAPLPAPAQPPGAAPAPGAASAPGAPVLAPAPGASGGAAVAQSTPAASSIRTFNCSCFGSGTRTRWIGQVQAQGYFQARQNAVNSCIAYNFNRAPGSAYVPPANFSFFPTPVPPVTASQTEPGLPNLQSQGLSGQALLNSPRSNIISACGLCACN
jgi:hypothetical protein